MADTTTVSVNVLDTDDLLKLFHKRDSPTWAQDLVRVEDAIIHSIQLGNQPNFEVNTTYSLRVLVAHLATKPNLLDPWDLTSAISRCVEYGLDSELDLLIAYWDSLPQPVVERRLLLRKGRLSTYLKAHRHGFHDPELDKRFIYL